MQVYLARTNFLFTFITVFTLKGSLIYTVTFAPNQHNNLISITKIMYNTILNSYIWLMTNTKLLFKEN